MINPMQMIQMLKGGKMNPQQLMGMMGSNPMMQQAEKMIKNTNNPQEVIFNVAKQKGIDEEQLKQLANNFGIKL